MKMKFWYVTVLDRYTTIFRKQCMSVKDANDLLKLKREEYPKETFPNYMITKDMF